MKMSGSDTLTMKHNRFPTDLKKLISAGVWLIASSLCACASAPARSTDEDLSRFTPGRWLQLQTNIRPDSRGYVSALNYQTQKFIPRCTEVLITSLDAQQMAFKTSDGEEYVWKFEERISEPPLRHLARLFVPVCDHRKLSEEDLAGIKVGKGKKGMTRWGIFFAMGYPPDDLTPDADADQWTYWKYKNITMTLRFDRNGVVTGFGKSEH